MDSMLQPEDGERPSAFAERMGKLYASMSTAGSKKTKGQFFTPLSISRFMGSLAKSPRVEISVLDPGCGCGILSSCLIENLALNHRFAQVHLTAYETDAKVIPYATAVFQYLKQWLLKRGITLDFFIRQDDFVLTNAECLCEEPTLFDGSCTPKYDYIISNPPYFKLSKDDPRVKASSSVVDGVANIYALFLAISAKMLSGCGQIIFITPRSFASGRYFRLFRNFFFSTVSLDFIHLFNTRRDTFAKDDVLQELLIMRGRPICDDARNREITVSYSEGAFDLDKAYTKNYLEKDIIDVSSEEKILYLPISSRDEAILNLFKSWDGNMSKFNIQVSTGPVVAFRSEEYLSPEESEETVPLYWCHNVVKMLCDHPVEKKGRCQYIRVSQGSKSSLLPNKNYILLRRFSAKDDESRLVAAPYFGNASKYRYVGVENKLNYIYRPKGHLIRSEVMGISALLNSELYDSYFRLFNGNINVSSTELRMMPFPPIKTIREIGNSIILNNDYSMEHINKVVYGYFKI